MEGKRYQTDQWLRMLIDTAEDYAIFAVTPEGKVCTWNKGAQRLFGYSEEEILGQDFSIIFTPEDREKGVPAAEVQRAQEHGYSPDERWHLRKDGSRLFVSGAVRPLRESPNRLLGFLKVAHDITARMQAEQDLKLANEELRHSRRAVAQANTDLEVRVQERTRRLSEKVQELEAFSYSLSHDMRAPLRAMQSFAQILCRDFSERVGAEGTDLLNRIATAAARLDQLIEDVLSLSRLSRERIENEPVDLEKLLRAILQERPAFQLPQAEIQIVAPLARVMGHEASLSQCFSNLLDNAVKFVPAEARPRIRIRTETRGEVVRVWVEDNGIGVPKEDAERIFGIFQRLHGADRYSGTGIGLAIVRKAVERMRGTAGVESEPGQGSRFWIELPKA